ncbi:hypothetical protein N7471_010797 [Penicillium samsonianum]|uniref:uncharacterized protein n=1 Tax=Penicillium samsonianum TaxID=1882272 RepID=UPI002548AE30|nr:uncharacterized protein N7471_010797 [Penicillium samsonianum]KAJ6126304.1 hypothetical protein N7471_010797 [Penicillium samsonianum]
MGPELTPMIKKQPLHQLHVVSLNSSVEWNATVQAESHIRRCLVFKQQPGDMKVRTRRRNV